MADLSVVARKLAGKGASKKDDEDGTGADEMDLPQNRAKFERWSQQAG